MSKDADPANTLRHRAEARLREQPRKPQDSVKRLEISTLCVFPHRRLEVLSLCSGRASGKHIPAQANR